MAAFIDPCLLPGVLDELPARKRLVLKLRSGCSALSADEIAAVPAEMQIQAQKTKKRSLREVAALLGVSKERVRQIEDRSLVLLKRFSQQKTTA